MQPAFRRRVQAVRAEMLQRAAGTATAATAAALKALLELLSGSPRDAVRLGAARSLLDAAVKLREITDLEERLATLEEQAAAS
jgi:cobalamin biosynthesis protein CbiD